MSNNSLKQSDQIRLLKVVKKYTETGEWEGIFSYPNCGVDLVKMGLATEDKKITPAGEAALWLLGEAPDPTDSQAVQTFKLKTGDNDAVSTD